MALAGEKVVDCGAVEGRDVIDADGWVGSVEVGEPPSACLNPVYDCNAVDDDSASRTGLAVLGRTPQKQHRYDGHRAAAHGLPQSNLPRPRDERLEIAL
jgi:hypothetical protein